MSIQQHRNCFLLTASLFCWGLGFGADTANGLDDVTSALAVHTESDVNPGASPVDYESFGAVGDGVADDLPAICKAHAHANEHGVSVRSRPDATYHLGRQAMTAIIATDTDWNSSKFIIDDTEVDDHRKPLFEVRSLLEREDLTIASLKRDQKQSEVHPTHDCHVLVFNDKIKRYRRRGSNQNSGSPQRDCFILRRDGSIEGDIDWDYDHVTRVEARPNGRTTIDAAWRGFHNDCKSHEAGGRLQLLGEEHQSPAIEHGGNGSGPSCCR